MKNEKVCSVCRTDFTDDFIINDGEEHFCTNKCLNEVYSNMAYEVMYENDEAY